MDNLNSINSGNEELDKPIPFDDDLDKPIPFDDGSDEKTSQPPVSSASGGTAKTPAVGPVKRPVVSAVKKPVVKKVSTGRITGVKTFLAKLHIGSIDFIDQQINDWLKSNPGITIKRTNTATGMVTGKTTEPHIIVTIWY